MYLYSTQYNICIWILTKCICAQSHSLYFCHRIYLAKQKLNSESNILKIYNNLYLADWKTKTVEKTKFKNIWFFSILNRSQVKGQTWTKENECQTIKLNNVEQIDGGNFKFILTVIKTVLK